MKTERYSLNILAMVTLRHGVSERGVYPQTTPPERLDFGKFSWKHEKNEESSLFSISFSLVSVIGAVAL